MINFISIASFGALGVLSRFCITELSLKVFSSSFPLGTFVVNGMGAFLVGLLYGAGFERNVFSSEIRLGILVGFLGGFTTFSSYCVEAFRLLEEGRYRVAFFYFGFSPVLCLLLTMCGVWIARKGFGHF